MMQNILIYGMVIAGSVIMLVNIIQYIRYRRKLIKQWKLDRDGRFLRIPIVLLVLFLLGYIFVGAFGKPDVVMAGILFGGSIFVFVILLFMQRITKQIQETEDLRVSLQAAEQANKSKTSFLFNMSHDIRTPLNAVIGYSMVSEKEDLTLEQARGYLKKIHNAGRHLLDLINDVLEMSRIESGKMELDETDTDLNNILDDMRDLFTSQMKERQINYTVRTEGLQDPQVICDQVRLNRVLLNLISNACKFTPESGSVDVCLVQLGGGTTGKPCGCGGTDNTREERLYGVYEFRVSDTGIGMTQEFAEKVFEPFEREQTSTVSGIQGTGLGMTITKQIVDMMKGMILVDTAPGKGTVFTVRLKLKISGSPAHTAETVTDPGQELAEFCGRRVLLAEDVEVNREIAGILLSDMGLQVEYAADGKEAVEKVKQSRKGYYDAVLMDIQMPVMDGYEAARQIRALRDPDQASVPVIAMTANAFAEDRKKAKESGMAGHIAKPLDPGQMKSVLRHVWKG